MTLQLANITFDCADSARVAAFWSAALNRPLDDGPSQWFASIGRTDPSQTVWLFIKVPEGKAAKNRCHVDLHADSRAAEVARLLALGAQHVGDYDEHTHQWTTLRDVEGNEFCVF
ncbi:MAG TPA: VOC family protein [Chloroflexota bacterium]|nr:VOC family protein [Chloroflexota bacterium]